MGSRAGSVRDPYLPSVPAFFARAIDTILSIVAGARRGEGCVFVKRKYDKQEGEGGEKRETIGM